MRTADTAWFRRFRPDRADRRATVLMLPHAGGSAHVFAPWAAALPEDLRPIAVEYAGRGTRYREPCAREPAELLGPLADAVAAELDGPLVVAGHSLGGVLGFELAWRLSERGRPPVAFLASGARAPHEYAADSGPLHHLAEDELADELHRRGDIPAEVRQNAELRGLLIPMIRSDLALGARYRFGPRPRQLSCPVAVIGGDADPAVPLPDLYAWKAVCTRDPLLRVVPGGHFYHRDRLDEVIRLLLDVLDGTDAAAGEPR